MERPNSFFNSSCDGNFSPYPRYDEYFSPNATRSIYNETKYAHERQPMTAHKDQSSPVIIDDESDSKINEIMKVIESYSTKKKKIQPKIEQKNL